MHLNCYDNSIIHLVWKRSQLDGRVNRAKNMNPNMELFQITIKGGLNLNQEDVLILYTEIWRKQLIRNKDAIGILILNTEYRSSHTIWHGESMHAQIQR
jgi:hypothetical protein